MTPYELNVLLHYYAHADDHPDLTRNPPVWRLTISEFLRDDLIRLAVGERWDCTYMLTERGKFFVEQGLCALPLPIQRWEIPRATVD